MSGRGFTLVELLLVAAVAALLLEATATFTLPLPRGEPLPGAAERVRTYFELARLEAVHRNRDCRFVVDTTGKRLRVLDGMGTPSDSDDALLYEAELPASVRFARPDAGAPVTLGPRGAGAFEAVYDPRGAVASGAGAVVLVGREEYRRITALAAGGIVVERWDGTAWVSGS